MSAAEYGRRHRQLQERSYLARIGCYRFYCDFGTKTKTLLSRLGVPLWRWLQIESLEPAETNLKIMDVPDTTCRKRDYSG